MERSLSVLLPVCNAQSTLAVMVQEVLDVVSELTDHFELVIVDDGSADATSEVAQELTRLYPQVCAISHSQCLGREAAIRTGLAHSSGRIVFLRDETSGLALDAVAKLWKSAPEDDWLTDSETSSGRRWTRFSAGHAVRRAGFQVFARQAAEHLHRSSQPVRPNYLARLKNFTLGE
ncbi:MAG: glycosyltransferase [Pirellulales bacterium]|nr:glycosyltransferase [Pirellulales bacterium]